MGPVPPLIGGRQIGAYHIACHDLCQSSSPLVLKADEATEAMNLWVKKKTSGLIKEILLPNAVDVSIKLIIANDVYFK